MQQLVFIEEFYIRELCLNVYLHIACNYASYKTNPPLTYLHGLINWISWALDGLINYLTSHKPLHFSVRNNSNL